MYPLCLEDKRVAQMVRVFGKLEQMGPVVVANGW